jgi:chromosome partitioning protein
MRLVISTIHQKGGVGKTTLSVCLAGELAKRGFDPLLVDADPTESAQAWAKAGRLDFNVVGYPVVPGQTVAWAESISKLESKVFVIDCGPNDYSLAAACALTDVALLPCGASGLDLDGTVRALRQIGAVRAQRRAPLNVFVVPTRVDGRTIEGRQLVDQLRALGEVVTRPMTSRVDYVRAFTAGLSIHAYASGSEADQEIKALTDQVLDSVAIRTAA